MSRTMPKAAKFTKSHDKSSKAHGDHGRKHDDGGERDHHHDKDPSDSHDSDPDGMGFILSGEAIAIGTDTLSIVDANGKIVEMHGAIIARGIIKVTAAADGADDTITFAGTDADVFVSGADKVMIKETTVIGDEASYTFLTFKAIDLPRLHGETKVIYKEKVIYDDDFKIDVDGNIAAAKLDVAALGENTLVDVQAFVLAIEDQLSESSVLVTAAVA